MFNNNSRIAPPPERSLTKRTLDLYRKFVDILSLAKRNILISPQRGETEFLSEFCELRNFREGYKFDIFAQHKIGFEPSPEFLSSPLLTKKFNPLTKREGSDSVITDDIINMNHSQLITHHSPKQKVAFTLAEVLITLGIIGVVAALTMPSLIQHFKDEAIIAQTKKSYSNFLNVLNLLKADEGTVDYADIFKENETPITIVQKFAKYYNGAKVCTNSNIECGSLYYAKLAFATNDGKGNIKKERVNFPRLILPDGSLLYLRDLRGNCNPFTYTVTIKDSNGFDTGETKTYTDTRCATIVLDANGYNKGPNQYGADIHQIIIRPTGITPSDNQYGALHSIFTYNKLKYEKYSDNKTF